MSVDLNRVIEQVSKEKGIDKTIVVNAVEEMMHSAARRTFGPDRNIESRFNSEIGEIELFEIKTVVETVANAGSEVEVEDARTKYDPEAQVGDEILIKLDTATMGRIAAQAAKQNLIQHIRDAETSVRRRFPFLVLVELMFVIRSLDFVEAKALAAMAVFVVKLQSMRADRGQHALKILAPVMRAMRPHLHALADVGLEMRQLSQRTVDTRRRYFEQITSVDGIVNIEQVADYRAQYFQIAHRDSAAGTIHQQPQQRSPRTLAEVDSDQLEALSFDMRFEQFDHLFRDRMQL